MEKISRRNVLGVAAAALASSMAARAAESASGNPPKAKEAAASEKTESIYKFRMGEAPARHYGDSSVRSHKLQNFPASSKMAATILRLAPGDFREPHWHPNADEWLFVMSGNIRMTIVDVKGVASQFSCGPEDVATVPQGFGHYVENNGDAEAVVMVVHNNAEFTTVDLSEWVAGGSLAVFASTLNIPQEAFKDAPKKRVYIGKKKKSK